MFWKGIDCNQFKVKAKRLWKIMILIRDSWYPAEI
jgi:hypothetical protein